VPRTGTYLLHRGEVVVPTGDGTELAQPANTYIGKDGGMQLAKKNPDPGKFWRLAFSPDEARQAHESGDPAEMPLLFPKSGVRRGPGQRAALAEASRRVQHQDPLRPFGEFLDKLTAQAAPTQGRSEFPSPPIPSSDVLRERTLPSDIPNPYPPRLIPQQEFRKRGIF